MLTRMGLTCFVAGALAAAGLAQDTARKIDSKLVLSSSDAQLVEGFNWAKQQALAYAFDGDPVGPWIEASLPGREAFCMRDTAHQAMGAHALAQRFARLFDPSSVSLDGTLNEVRVHTEWESRFGVSTPLWDHVFGTEPSKGEARKPKS